MSLENTKQFPKLKPKLEGWQNGAMQQQFVRQGHNTFQPSASNVFDKSLITVVKETNYFFSSFSCSQLHTSYVQTGPTVRCESKKRYKKQGVAIKQWQGHSWHGCTFSKSVWQSNIQAINQP